MHTIEDLPEIPGCPSAPRQVRITRSRLHHALAHTDERGRIHLEKEWRCWCDALGQELATKLREAWSEKMSEADRDDALKQLCLLLDAAIRREFHMPQVMTYRTNSAEQGKPVKYHLRCVTDKGLRVVLRQMKGDPFELRTTFFGNDAKKERNPWLRRRAECRHVTEEYTRVRDGERSPVESRVREAELDDHFQFFQIEHWLSTADLPVVNPDPPVQPASQNKADSRQND